MPVTRLQVFYNKGGTEKWTNVYHADGADLTVVASAFDEAMKLNLRGLAHISVLLEKVLISSLTDDTFLEVPINMAGVNGDTDDLMPLFNCAKVLFPTEGFGRPDYKFLKGTLTDDANESGFIASSVIAAIVGAFDTTISDMSINSAPLCSEAGDLWTSTSVQSKIQMRQMHRRRKRTVTP
jgi:hypothetical protein